MATDYTGTAGNIMGSTSTEDRAATNPVKIEKVANGFILTVGCKTLIAKTWKEVSEGLEAFGSRLLIIY